MFRRRLAKFRRKTTVYNATCQKRTPSAHSRTPGRSLPRSAPFVFGKETMNWLELHQKLRKPFAINDVSFRPGQTSRDDGHAQALPYAEPRVYEDRLNEVLGADWSCRFLP